MVMLAFTPPMTHFREVVVLSLHFDPFICKSPEYQEMGVSIGSVIGEL